MSSRERIDRELERLQSMLPPWREKLRDEAQFWPQFDALVARILDRTVDADRGFVRRRVERMLAQEGVVRPPAQEVPPARRRR